MHPADRIRRPIRIARSALTRCADAVAASVRVPALDKAALRRKPIVEQMEAVLQQDLLENWFPRVLDEQAGGYRECFDRAWRLLDDTRRSLIYQCRIVWAAAAFAQYAPEHARSFGAHALHGVDFLERRLRDPEHGSFFFSIDKHGKPFREGEKHALTSAYTIFAFARAHAATGNGHSRELAYAEFAWLEAHAHDDDGGYHEAMRRDGTPILTPDPPPGRDLLWRPYGTKSLSTQVHVLEALTDLLAIHPTPLVRTRLEETHSLLLERSVTTDGDLLASWDESADDRPHFASGGYMMETACFLIEAARALGEEIERTAWQIARRIVDRTLERHWDSHCGGVYATPSTTPGASMDTREPRKDWWAQAESLRALAWMDSRFGATTGLYREALEKQWECIFESFIDARFGGWYRQTDTDGRVLGPRTKADAWQACYHSSRALMQSAQLLRSSDRHRAAMTDGSAMHTARRSRSQ